jgi:hypothetical protein
MSAIEWMNDFEDELSKRIDKVGRAIRDRIKEKINTPYPPASQPHNPPHRRSGKLRRGVRFRREPFTKDLMIWSQEEYSSFLEFGTEEFGTSKMEPREFFFDTIEEMHDEIQQILDGHD